MKALVSMSPFFSKVAMPTWSKPGTELHATSTMVCKVSSRLRGLYKVRAASAMDWAKSEMRARRALLVHWK